MKLKLRILALLLLATTVLVGQKQIPRRTTSAVNDFAGMLTSNERGSLERKLRQYQTETSTAIVIVTENSLEGEDDFSYTNRLAQEWGIGTEGNDNGILLYVAENDRKIRIQTGYGSEGFLPDAMAKRIIDNIITPAFRQGNYYRGLNEATDAIMDLGRGEYVNPGDGKKDAQGGTSALYVIIFLIILIIIFSSFGNGGDDDDDDGGYYRGGRYDYPQRRRRRGGGWIVFPGGFGGGGGSGGGFGGGGGGFGGFGGGGFGGGGAGGGW